MFARQLGGPRAPVNFPAAGGAAAVKRRTAAQRAAATAAAAAAMVGLNGTRTSRYTGVRWDKVGCCYRASLQADGYTENLGRFDDERSAARAYDAAVRRRGQEPVDVFAEHFHALELSVGGHRTLNSSDRISAPL